MLLYKSHSKMDVYPSPDDCVDDTTKRKYVHGPVGASVTLNVFLVPLAQPVTPDQESTSVHVTPFDEPRMTHAKGELVTGEGHTNTGRTHKPHRLAHTNTHTMRTRTTKHTHTLNANTHARHVST